MGLQDVKPKAPTTYYGYKELDEPKDNYKKLKKEMKLTGFYFKTYEKQGQYGVNRSHVLIDENNDHHVISGSTDIDKEIAEFATVGLYTEITFLGKNSFDYTDKETGKKGKASAYKFKIQQDPDKRKSFVGDTYAAKLADYNAESATEKQADVTTDDIPF